MSWSNKYLGFGKEYSQIVKELTGVPEREIYINSHLESLNYYINNQQWDRAELLIEYLSTKMDTQDPLIINSLNKINGNQKK